MKENIKNCFLTYQESIFTIDQDLQFWNSYLEAANKTFINNSKERTLRNSIFFAYDMPYDTIGGELKSNKREHPINVSELESKRIDFFAWVINLSILKAYNSLEILILQGIQLAYFANLENPINGKKQCNKLQEEIKKVLTNEGIKHDTINNDYIIKFLILKSYKVKSFLELPMSSDLKTKWIDFFTLISILRNVIAHNSMCINLDIHNEIKSKSKDIFERHFDLLKKENGQLLIKPKQVIFNEFITRINSIAVNIYKYIFDMNNLEFIELN